MYIRNKNTGLTAPDLPTIIGFFPGAFSKKDPKNRPFFTDLHQL